jgi:hypothetical protein
MIIDAETGYAIASKRDDELIAKNSESESFKGNGKFMVCVKTEDNSELMCAPKLTLYCGICGNKDQSKTITLVWNGGNDTTWQPHSSVESSLSSELNVKQPANENELDRIRFGISGAFSGFSPMLDVKSRTLGFGIGYKTGIFLDIPLYTIYAPSGNRPFTFSPEINYAYRTFWAPPLEIKEQLITIPLLLTDRIFEFGFQFGFPLKTITDRKNIDYEFIIGARLSDDDFFWGFRIGYNFGDFNKKRSFTAFELTANLLF